jgi:hypothetical protein
VAAAVPLTSNGIGIGIGSGHRHGHIVFLSTHSHQHANALLHSSLRQCAIRNLLVLDA